eukprot:Lankesteria_metandrocarpae@DN4195_c0_g1_i3.p1
MSKTVLGFIGAGRMACALATGVLNSNLCSKEDMFAFAQSERALAAMELKGVKRCTNSAELFRRANVVILAVQPVDAGGVAKEWKAPTKSSPHTLLISVLAGVSIKSLRNKFPGSKIVRAMPNTPCLVNKGASAYCAAPDVSVEDKLFVQRVFEAVGMVYEVDESQINAVTGVSGSGPAYAYTVIEAMAEGGVRSGLPYDIAVRLAAQTLAGAAEMVLSMNEHPAVLKSHVCSPGGTTIAAIAELEDGGIRATVMNAVGAAAERSREIGESAEEE